MYLYSAVTPTMRKLKLKSVNTIAYWTPGSCSFYSMFYYMPKREFYEVLLHTVSLSGNACKNFEFEFLHVSDILPRATWS